MPLGSLLGDLESFAEQLATSDASPRQIGAKKYE